MKKIKFFSSLLIFYLLFKPCSVFPDEVKSGSNYPTIKPFGFTHLWAQYDNTAGSSHGEDFDIARVRLGLKGNLYSNLDYMVLSEWGRLTYEDSGTLLDAWVNLKVSSAFNIKLGQSWYRFSRSGTEILPKIPFIFRPEVVDGIWLSMGRNGNYAYDKGVWLWGNLSEVTFPWGYNFSVTTGAGLDHFDDNEKKDFTGRLWIEPREDLQIGISGFYGYSRVAITSNLSREEQRDIPEYAYGFEAAYTKEKFRFIYEYLEGLYEGYLDINGAEMFQLATKKPRGWYVMAGYKPLPWIEIPLRYAWYEKDATSSDAGIHTITTGITWFLKEGTLNNIKLNYIIRSAEENYGSKPRNKVALQVQLVF